jgi:hypothetical protein
MGMNYFTDSGTPPEHPAWEDSDPESIPLEDLDVEEITDCGPFQPGVFYDPQADCIRARITNDSTVAEQVDQHLDVYRSRIDGRVVGFLIHGVKKLMEEAESEEDQAF